MEPLSSAAVVISSLIVTKAFEKTEEKLSEIFTDRLGKFINLIKGKELPKTKAIDAKAESADYAEAVKELEAATQSDTELSETVKVLAQTVEGDPSLLEKVRNIAVLVKDEPNIILNQTKLAEKIGLVVQGGTINIISIGSNCRGNFKAGRNISIGGNFEAGLSRLVEGDAAWTSNINNFKSACPGDLLVYIYVEMDETVIIQRVTTLEVLACIHKIDYQTGPTSQGGKVGITSERPLIVQAIARNNFAVVGDDRIEVNPPSKKESRHIYFDLRPTDLGEGEVWIVVRQGQMLLLTLTVKPRIVEARAQVKNMMASLAAAPPKSAKTNATGGLVCHPSASEPLHQLRIIEQRNGNQITYRYELDSPSLGLLREFQSKPITSNRQEYVWHLYNEIESRWVSNIDDTEAFAEELRAFGGSLFDELFPSELRVLLWEHHTKIDSIMVLSTEPFIPWELIHLKQPGHTHLPDETKFLAQMGLVRWLYEGGRFPPQTIQIHKGRVSYIIPHYPGPSYRLPKAEEEYQFLKDTFQAHAISPNSSEVRRVLKACSFDLLHFAGHGTAEQGNIGNAKLMMEGRIEGNGPDGIRTRNFRRDRAVL
jgi:hypothetical protein